MRLIKLALVILLLGEASAVSAGVIAENTRIIYNLDRKEQSFQFFNINDYPVLVQLWVDDGRVDGSPDKAIESPVIPLPAIFKLKSGDAKNIRFVKVDDNLANDRETLYWLNVYEVPPLPDTVDKSKDNAVLILTTRTQMKLFLRPGKLFSQASTMATNISFKWDNESLALINDSPFFVTITSLMLVNSEDKLEYNGMLAPFSQTAVDWKLKTQPDALIITYIDDYGSQNEFTIKVKK